MSIADCMGMNVTGMDDAQVVQAVVKSRAIKQLAGDLQFKYGFANMVAKRIALSIISGTKQNASGAIVTALDYLDEDFFDLGRTGHSLMADIRKAYSLRQTVTEGLEAPVKA